MFSGIGATGVLLILLIALLLFGPNKLPELGRAFGRTLREFKAGARDIMDDEDSKGSSRKEIAHEEAASKTTSLQNEPPRRLPD
ncbi:MAG: twin-arginine translocase TatA/TatE family subunit [Paenibacillus sp.]|uniref:Sec-independent protein translocase protein TatA n=1 Tax=Paenibacillus aquistagni TaxID=1852522 RepID=A0A1X7K9W0_9BACL|nr:twin-arginine translocase TatA/TatE family subunit [Paenibacillus aquistagni]MBR2568165.1 twin-arginine translocase TatA/TatE family subunit [Paenibacillus sp.]NMM53602.1 twin-arginine translocase TatA/TatE family subunit [Paenibacillus aquistagni]SMG37140.1 sec-independent protein translocase protein TatA [Paenibacillus aquistagni]